MITNSFEETQKAGFDFAKTLKGGDVVCLHGDLGGGKTTFVQGLAKGLGIEKKIISPTFIIMRSYELGSKNFYHVDLYRVENERDIEGLGLLDLMENEDAIVVIEWAEKIADRLPTNRKEVFFTYLDEDKREISFQE